MLWYLATLVIVTTSPCCFAFCLCSLTNDRVVQAIWNLASFVLIRVWFLFLFQYSTNKEKEGQCNQVIWYELTCLLLNQSSVSCFKLVMQPCFKDQVEMIWHFSSDTCHPGLCCSAFPISGACAICENELSHPLSEVFIYVLSVELDAIVYSKHKLCFEYQKYRQCNKATSHGKIQEASSQSSSSLNSQQYEMI